MAGAIIYWILLVINCVVIKMAGVNSWHYWISLLCIMGSYICGSATNKG